MNSRLRVLGGGGGITYLGAEFDVLFYFLGVLSDFLGGGFGILGGKSDQEIAGINTALLKVKCFKVHGNSRN